MRVFGWSNAQGGVHHYRVREPLRALSLRGHETKTLPAATAEVFEHYDVVLVRGLHNPKNSMLWRWAAATGQPALRVYDLDDDLWSWNPGSAEDQYWNDERRLEAELNIQCADLVTVPNHAMAALLAELNPHVAVLPNTIPERLLTILPEKRERFIIGWQGAAQHVKDLQLIYNPILRFMLEHPNVEFHVWGPQGTLDFPEALEPRIVVHPWVQSVWGHYYRLNMDVGLAPLNGDTFNLTKSDIRIREYAALGIPFIASHSEAYTNTAMDARGIVADTEQEWEQALEGLYQNPIRRDSMAHQGRLRARLWTTENNGIEWERAYVRAGYARNLRESPDYSTSPPAESAHYAGNGDRAIADIRTTQL